MVPTGYRRLDKNRCRRAVVEAVFPNESGGDIPQSGVVARDETWDRELEHAWPVIQQVAERLLSGPVAGHTIRALLDDGMQLHGGMD